MVILNLHLARKSNKLVCTIYAPSRAAIFACFVNEPSRARLLTNEPDQAEPSGAELAGGPALVEWREHEDTNGRKQRGKWKGFLDKNTKL